MYWILFLHSGQLAWATCQLFLEGMSFLPGWQESPPEAEGLSPFCNFFVFAIFPTEESKGYSCTSCSSPMVWGQMVTASFISSTSCSCHCPAYWKPSSPSPSNLFLVQVTFLTKWGEKLHNHCFILCKGAADTCKGLLSFWRRGWSSHRACHRVWGNCRASYKGWRHSMACGATADPVTGAGAAARPVTRVGAVLSVAQQELQLQRQ